MWIVRLALRRPYTFVVMALLMIIMGVLAIVRMPADIFPDINIPVASVIWSYGGLSAEQISEMITVRSERSYTTVVNDIEHMESQSLNGVSVIKLFFQPEAKIEAAVAQLSASSQSLLRQLPQGTNPPTILRYSASSVPILQLSLSSETLAEQELSDYSTNFVRTQLANVQGASVTGTIGGKTRVMMIDLDPKALYGQGVSPGEVSKALNNQNVILPSGLLRIGKLEYVVRLNSAPEDLATFNDLPVKQNGATTLFVRDVGQIRDGYGVQNSVVRSNGTRGVYLSIMKSGSASTLDIANRVKEMLPRIRATLPPELNMDLLLDQSVFVKAAIQGVAGEALGATLLTALMILLFLGSWRSTLIGCISIPLSILTSLAVLNWLGETINVMTLGGLALAVGILVDNATVAVENIDRNLSLGKPLLIGIIDGSAQIALPALVSTLCICIVFVPVIFLTGTAQYLFTPMAMAVVFAMLASYLLSRTLVVTMAKYLLHEHDEGKRGGFFKRIHHIFQYGFERMRDGYRGLLETALDHRIVVILCFVVICGACVALYPYIGMDFYPTVDAGVIRLHVRAPAGTRLEQTEAYFGQVEDSIKKVIPPAELESVLDNIGLSSGASLAYSDSGTLGPFDGEILISLRPGEHGSISGYTRDIRTRLNADYPNLMFFFQSGDIVGQTLNFGRPAPIDIQVIGPIRNTEANFKVAKDIEASVRKVPGAADVHVHQIRDLPELEFNVDRTKAGQLGITQRDVADAVLTALSSTSQTSPNFWINPVNNVDYQVSVMAPVYRMDSIDALLRVPVRASDAYPTELFRNLVQVSRDTTSAVVNHYNAQPLFNIYANIQDRDLGGVASDIDKVLAGFKAKLPRGTVIETRGQVETMNSSFRGLGIGMIFAILLVYLVMVVNYQSWLDPFIILMALPGALAGILLMLYLTQTTINVPSFMGAIMSVGVATANSILLVTFANDLRATGLDSISAALEAGYTRLRPVLMTALAMIAGMVPMALGRGEGGEQNAPLGRAVIGGLVMATVATLILVPVIYSLLRKQPPKNFEEAEVET